MIKLFIHFGLELKFIYCSWYQWICLVGLSASSLHRHPFGYLLVDIEMCCSDGGVDLLDCLAALMSSMHLHWSQIFPSKSSACFTMICYSAQPAPWTGSSACWTIAWDFGHTGSSLPRHLGCHLAARDVYRYLGASHTRTQPVWHRDYCSSCVYLVWPRFHCTGCVRHLCSGHDWFLASESTAALTELCSSHSQLWWSSTNAACCLGPPSWPSVEGHCCT